MSPTETFLLWAVLAEFAIAFYFASTKRRVQRALSREQVYIGQLDIELTYQMGLASARRDERDFLERKLEQIREVLGDPTA